MSWQDRGLYRREEEAWLYLAGLIEGLKVTAKTLSRRSVTEQYPDVQPERRRAPGA